MPVSEGKPPHAFWLDFAIKMTALAAGLFSAAPIRESLGWPDDALYTVAISLPVMILVHLALQRLFRPRA